jgi:hypothetical protein
MEIEVPESWEKFQLPAGLNKRLQELLDRQDRGDVLSADERDEAQGIVDIAEWLSLLKLRAGRLASQSPDKR